MADISYTRTTWADGAEGGTAIDATKLNNIEQGIVDAVAAIGPNDTTEDGTLKAQIDSVRESVSLTSQTELVAGVKYQSFGPLVLLDVSNYPLPSQKTTVGQLPSGFRPNLYRAYPLYPEGYVDIDSNGNVGLKGSGNGYGTAVFFKA